MAIPVVGSIASTEISSSCRMTRPIVDLIIPRLADNVDDDHLYRQAGQGDLATEPILMALTASRNCARSESSMRNKASHKMAQSLKAELSQTQQFLVDIAQEKGVSSWLTSYPLTQHRTVQSKADFRDAVCIHYEFPINNLPTCVCGEPMTADHAFTCPSRWSPMARHDEVKNG